MKTLNLTLKRHWFDLILRGEKTEEYREIKPYWVNRILMFDDFLTQKEKNEAVSFLLMHPLCKERIYERMSDIPMSFRHYDQIKFRNGYAKDAPTFTVPLKEITIDTGRLEWGAEEGKYYFVLRLGKCQDMNVMIARIGKKCQSTILRKGCTASAEVICF
jgi:hypothetical protein